MFSEVITPAAPPKYTSLGLGRNKNPGILRLPEGTHCGLRHPATPLRVELEIFALGRLPLSAHYKSNNTYTIKAISQGRQFRVLEKAGYLAPQYVTSSAYIAVGFVSPKAQGGGFGGYCGRNTF